MKQDEIADEVIRELKFGVQMFNPPVSEEDAESPNF
jgi:hypothetical protein